MKIAGVDLTIYVTKYFENLTVIVIFILLIL